MKILRLHNPVRGLALLFVIVSCLAVVMSDDPLKKNQLKAFPLYAAPPTEAAQIKDFNYTAPKLSHALLETDPTRPLKKNEFFETVKYSFYKITRGELEQMFIFIDQNHDDLVSAKEWDDFSELYLFPFEACDKSGDNLLDDKEFKECFEADPKSKTIEFRRRYQENRHKLMIDVLRTGSRPELNFGDYLFMRKAMFGWTTCHSNQKYMAKSHFKCAIISCLPQKYSNRMDFDMLYTVGLKLAGDRNLIEVDFLTYIRVAHYIYIFSVFNQPLDSPYLEKAQFLKAVREDRLPNNFEEAEIEYMYELTNTSPLNTNNKVASLDFESWAFFYTLHRLFNTYSMEKPLQLNLQEFLKLLEDPFTNKLIVMAIDNSFTNFKESDYQEASLALQRYRASERSFFYGRFKERQDASFRSASAFNKSTINATFYDIHSNGTNREVFFSINAETNKKFWTRRNLFRSFQLANLYLAVMDLKDTKVVTIPITTFLDKLNANYDTIRPAINFNQRKNYVIYKNLPNEVTLDLLNFMCLESFYFKFQIENLSSDELINEALLKVILKDFGMTSMPDTVIDLAMKNYDSMRRRMYIPMQVTKYTLIVQAAAGENERAAGLIKEHGLKINNEISRKFPGLRRKFVNSDRV